jgi:dihydrofolate reductase
MRTLYLFDMMTLDGFFEGPAKWEIGWHNVDAEFNEFSIDQLNATDLLLFGRVTYEGMASYWPTPAAMEDDPEVADKMNSIAKIVFSRTLEKADWNNTRLIHSNTVEEVLKLKRLPGKDMAIFGSANLASTLIKQGLIDEYRIIVNPIVLGKGTALFGGISDQIKLKLVSARAFKSGNVLLRYRPVQD